MATTSIQAFINSSNIKDIVARAEKLKKDGIRFSDITDAEGHQYVDLIQEGGGVLGVALVGYTYVLEKAGIRFFSLAGTSAGAINTMIIAALGKINEAKSEKILEILSQKDLFDLVDGDKATKKIIRKAVNKEGGIFLSLALNVINIYKTLKEKLGLNPGNDFEQWITAELHKAGINTLEDLEKLRAQLPEGLRHREEKPVNDMKPRLAIITSDITTNSKIEFPKMAGLYWDTPANIPPATLVRASMSIPFFFAPFTRKNIPNAGTSNDPLWDKYCRYTGPVPATVRFVDGGLLSNFPINIFHRPDNNTPRMPSFGVRLSVYREAYNKTDTLSSMSGAMISTMRQIYDYDFLLKNPDYRKLICRIDADKEYNWLNFSMSREEQIALFQLGAGKAIEFLEQFDWAAYKELRSKLPKVSPDGKTVQPSFSPSV